MRKKVTKSAVMNFLPGLPGFATAGFARAKFFFLKRREPFKELRSEFCKLQLKNKVVGKFTAKWLIG